LQGTSARQTAAQDESDTEDYDNKSEVDIDEDWRGQGRRQDQGQQQRIWDQENANQEIHFQVANNSKQACHGGQEE